MLAAPGSAYCRCHSKKKGFLASTLAAELSRAAGSLEAPEDVNRVLAKIFLALAEDRLSTRKAAVLGYLGQMLLRSHREIAFHKKLADEEAERNYSGPPNVLDILGITSESPAPSCAPTSDPPSQTDSASTNEPNSTATTEQQPAASPDQPAPINSAPSSSTSSPPPKPPNLDHFYPRDPALPPGLQDPNRFSSPTPSLEELERRNARLDTALGSRSSSVKRSYPQHQDPDWKIINGR